LLANGNIFIGYMKSKNNVINPLTKGLTIEQVDKSSREMGVKPVFKRITMLGTQPS
jgi:hypothetical protein